VILGLMVLGSGGGARCADDDGGVTGASPMIVVISNSTFLDSLVKLTCPMSLQDYVSEGVRTQKITHPAKEQDRAGKGGVER
jgi:hypothetical protein